MVSLFCVSTDTSCVGLSNDLWLECATKSTIQLPLFALLLSLFLVPWHIGTWHCSSCCTCPQCFVEHSHRQSYLYLEPEHAETDKVNLKNNEIIVIQLEIINCRFKTLLIIVSILLFLTLCFKVTSTHRKWVYFGIWVKGESWKMSWLWQTAASISERSRNSK